MFSFPLKYRAQSQHQYELIHLSNFMSLAFLRWVQIKTMAYTNLKHKYTHAIPTTSHPSLAELEEASLE